MAKKKYPKNPYKNIGICDAEFQKAIDEDRAHRKRRFGSEFIIR